MSASFIFIISLVCFLFTVSLFLFFFGDKIFKRKYKIDLRSKNKQQANVDKNQNELDSSNKIEKSKEEKINEILSKHFFPLRAENKRNYSRYKFPDHFESINSLDDEDKKNFLPLIRKEKNYEIIFLHHYVHNPDIPGKHFKTSLEGKKDEYPIYLGFILSFQLSKKIPDELQHFIYSSANNNFGKLITNSNDILDPDFSSASVRKKIPYKDMIELIDFANEKLSFDFSFWFRSEDILLYLYPEESFSLDALEKNLLESSQIFYHVFQ